MTVMVGEDDDYIPPGIVPTVPYKMFGSALLYDLDQTMKYFFWKFQQNNLFYKNFLKPVLIG